MIRVKRLAQFILSSSYLAKCVLFRGFRIPCDGTAFLGCYVMARPDCLPTTLKVASASIKAGGFVMKQLWRSGLPGAAICLLFFTASVAHAQIVGQINADIHHKFIVGNATLPPGHYVFRMLQGEDQGVMDASSADGNAGAEFMVRMSVDSHTPRHTEFIFDRYDDKEFLAHIYEGGNKNGVTVIEPSRIEARLEKAGKVPVEHTEEQP